MKANAAEDPDEGLDQLDDKHQKEGEIYESQNDEDRVCNPLTPTSTN